MSLCALGMVKSFDMAMDFGARSDIGRVRENNEDSFRVAPELGLFVLCDGMGGQASGEVASRLAAETVIAHCREAEENPSLPLIGERIHGASSTANRLASAVRLASRVVHQAAQQNEAQTGMGATVVAVQLTDERMTVAHVGDSRAYRLRNGELEPLTRDHSFIAEQVRQGLMTAEEASQSKLQNVLLRALGIEPDVEVEVNEELLMEGDAVLLCSDGLTHELSDEQIAATLCDAEEAHETVHEAAGRLIDLANQAGGGDNITVIVLRHAPKFAGAMARIGRWFKGS
ncbi:MAG TPA: Stp1/IreP family PP2C-type Ser/Thr phosphatase [Candidatus Acidoferrales bacterium]|nr:Stp1/IreP family PP2C-type Ser/Thr phosphatase [Candidatus Acidoferrales bacterium]